MDMVMGVLIGLVVAIVALIVFTFIFMWIWNLVMPDVFGVKQLTPWQAFGILLLAKLLFGGFGQHHPGSRHPDRFRRWARGNGTDGWSHYGRFWREKGDNAVEGLIDRARAGKSREKEEKP